MFYGAHDLTVLGGGLTRPVLKVSFVRLLNSYSITTRLKPMPHRSVIRRAETDWIIMRWDYGFVSARYRPFYSWKEVLQYCMAC